MKTASSSQSSFDIPFFDSLSSPVRIQILCLLNDNKYTVSEIAKKLRISIPATRKHLSNLEKASLVKTDSDGRLLLSTLAEIVVSQFPLFRFLSSFAEYVNDHKIEVLPKSFLYRLGELENAWHIQDTFSAYERAKHGFDMAKKFISASLVEIPLQAYMHAIEKASQGVSVSLLYGTNTYFPKEFEETRKENAGKIKHLVSKGIFEERQLNKNIQVTLGVTENQAMLGLPTHNDVIGSPKSGLVGTDSNTINWCNDLFNHYWEQSKPVEYNQSINF